MEEIQSRYARRYDREFKENAVALVESGKEIKEVAWDLGVSHWSLKTGASGRKPAKTKRRLARWMGKVARTVKSGV